MLFSVVLLELYFFTVLCLLLQYFSHVKSTNLLALCHARHIICDLY